jgi:hypothetical protein
MINASNFNINSFSNAAEVLRKGEDTVKMQKKEFIDEHKKLVKVLRSDSHADDKKEADEQEAELNEIEKGKKSPVGTVSNGYKKIADGKWQKVTVHGLTHNETKERMKKPITKQEGNSHVEALKKIDDKEYDDAHVMNSKNKEASKDKLKKSQNMNSVSRFNHFNMASFQENAVDVKSEHNVTDFEEIQKGQISNAFGHSQEIKVDKKGSEIKANLKVARDKEQMECTQFQTQLEAVKANIQTEPTENIDDWATEGLDITIMPKKFNWSECYCNEDNEYSDQSMKSEKQLLCDAKREYNNTAEKFVKCQVELHILDTMMNNIADNKVYSLSVKQAAILGF